MIDNWINQAAHLSPAQAVFLLGLSITLVGLLMITKGLETDV